MTESKTLEKVHKIMERLYEKRINMSDEEVINDINKSSEEFMKKHNLKLRRIKRTFVAA